MRRQQDMDDLLAAVSEEETLEAQRDAVVAEGVESAQVRRLDRLIVEAMKREVEAEGEDDVGDGG